ncbi:hypothetical protein CsSME_00001359 [Camellia sinensis var. sinensis]
MGQQILHIATLALQSLWEFCIKESRLLVLWDDNWFVFKVEFVGGPMCWNTRTFSAAAGGGAFCNGQKIQVSHTDKAQFMQGKGTEKKVEQSLLVTGFGYEHDDAWSTNIDLFKEFTDVSRGVRRLGAAAVDMCHVALGIVEAYWEYRLKPWDMAAGVLISMKELYIKQYPINTH